MVSSQKKWKKQHFWDWLRRGGGGPFFTFFLLKNNWKCLPGHQGDSSGLIGGEKGEKFDLKNGWKNRKIKESTFFRISSKFIYLSFSFYLTELERKRQLICSINFNKIQFLQQKGKLDLDGDWILNIFTFYCKFI